MQSDASKAGAADAERYVEWAIVNMEINIENISDDEKRLIDAMCQLYAQGVDVVVVDNPKHNQLLFPNGVNNEQYNDIVPRLVQKGIVVSRYDAPRDGPLLSLTKNARDYFGDSQIQHNNRMQSDAAEPRRWCEALCV